MRDSGRDRSPKRHSSSRRRIARAIFTELREAQLPPYQFGSEHRIDEERIYGRKPRKGEWTRGRQYGQNFWRRDVEVVTKRKPDSFKAWISVPPRTIPYFIFGYSLEILNLNSGGAEKLVVQSKQNTYATGDPITNRPAYKTLFTGQLTPGHVAATLEQAKRILVEQRDVDLAAVECALSGGHWRKETDRVCSEN